MLTPASVESVLCKWELDYAIKRGKSIIPVLLGKNINLPALLADIQYVDFSESIPNDAVAKLMGGVSSVQKRKHTPILIIVFVLLMAAVAGGFLLLPWTSVTEFMVALGVIPATGTPTTTYTPSPTSSGTPTSTQTATPSNTPTLTPTQTLAPLMDTTALFKRILDQNIHVQQALGNRMQTQTDDVPESSLQKFENGLMIWHSGSKVIYVLLDNKTFLAFTDTWTSKTTPEPFCTSNPPPQDRLLPVLGFGKVWCDNRTVRQTIGFAVAPEEKYTFWSQSFDSGWLIRIGDTIYALMVSPGDDSGTWDLFYAYNYTPVSLKQQASAPTSESNLGLAPGDAQFQGIPFELGWKTTTQCQPPFEVQPTDIQLDVNIFRPLNVYLLLQAGWGLVDYNGNQFGQVVLTFSDGSQRTTVLTLGDNIRDWARERPNAVIEAHSPYLHQAWEGTAPDGTPGRIDMLTIDIPEKYSNQTLESIQITDTSDEIDPCIHLLAVTVASVQ